MRNSLSHPRPHQPCLLPTLPRKTASSSSHWEHLLTNRRRWYSQATSRPLRYYPQDLSWVLLTRLANHHHKRPLGHSMHSRWVLGRRTNKFTEASLEITSRESCSVKNDRTNIRSSGRWFNSRMQTMESWWDHLLRIKRIWCSSTSHYVVNNVSRVLAHNRPFVHPISANAWV